MRNCTSMTTSECEPHPIRSWWRILTFSTSLDHANATKTKVMVAKVKQWLAAKVPIDGIGSQAHLKAGMAKDAKGALDALCAAAPECAVTELDIVGARPDEYAAVAEACVAVKNCVGVTVWGVRDPDSWRSQNNPLLFDAGFKPKPAYKAILDAL
jgi:endo-1,4-beta-xylanase